MANDAEIRAAAMELWKLLTPPGDYSGWEKWILPAAKALEGAEKYRQRKSPTERNAT